MMLKNGDIDVIFNVAAPLVPQLLGDPNILVVPTSVTTYMWVVLDTSIPPLNDKRVRQALAYAIDYDEMISIVWHGYAKLMHGVLPEGLLGYDETLPTCQENITKAKELLAEAGYPDGFTLDAVFRPEAARRSVAELLIGYFAKIGVTLNLLEVEAPLVWSMIAEHKAPVAPMAWYAAYPDPDFIITQYYAGGGLAYYSNPEVDELIELSRTETNLTERTKIYRDIQLIVFEDMPYINIAQTPFIYAQRTWVTDYNYNPAIGWYFNCYDYKKG
jgi:peptide/nickel transport system substrate-binding protein